MKRTITYILFYFFVISGLSAQRYSGHYGHSSSDGYSILMIGGGPAYLFGDVGGKMDAGSFKGTYFNPASISASGIIGYRYIFPNNLSLKFNLVYGSYTGTDSLTLNGARGFNLVSNIFEGSVQGEIFILGGPRQIGNTPHSLYIFGGAGLLFQNPNITPEDKIRDSDTYLRGFGRTPVLPFGAGYEFYIGNSFSVGGEMSFRYAFGDYLDGVKTKYSDNNDIIIHFNLALSYNFSLGRAYR